MEIYYIIIICTGLFGIICLTFNVYKMYKQHKANKELIKVLQFIIIDNVNEETRKRHIDKV